MTGDLPANTPLIRPCDVRGLLHTHTRYGDGAHSLRRMLEIAQALGLDYLGISDHLRSDEHPEGLELDGERQQRAEIDALQCEFPDVVILHGVEVNVEADGSIDLPDELLSQLDYVLADLPDPNGHTKNSFTEAALRVVRNPAVNVVSKPVGSYMITKPPVPLDMVRLLEAAAATGTVVELDANPAVTDLDDAHCRLAVQLGVRLAINPNAHRAARLVDYRHGVAIAREMGLECEQIVNTWSLEKLRESFA